MSCCGITGTIPSVQLVVLPIPGTGQSRLQRETLLGELVDTDIAEGIRAAGGAAFVAGLGAGLDLAGEVPSLRNEFVKLFTRVEIRKTAINEFRLKVIVDRSHLGILGSRCVMTGPPVILCWAPEPHDQTSARVCYALPLHTQKIAH